MEPVYTGVQQLIGRTPLLELRSFHLPCRILGKLEAWNPFGSTKDRAAMAMLEDAILRGRLAPGGVIIEPTSGNTGIALCALAASMGFRAVIVMPGSMSVERRRLMEAYGGEVVFSPAEEGIAGAMDMANALAARTPGSFIPGQFENSANPAAHFRSTGPEIWAGTGGTVDIFVAGIGTGGTITGVGRYLKTKNAAVRVVGVEPAGSPVLSGGQPGPHGIQGIGAGFVPKTLDTAMIDEVLSISDEAAAAMARRMARQEGLLAGVSSGAALAGAELLARRPENRGRTIVALLPDSGERYLSTGLFEAGA